MKIRSRLSLVDLEAIRYNRNKNCAVMSCRLFLQCNTSTKICVT